MLLSHMTIHDLANTRMSTFYKLPQEAVASQQDIAKRLPPDVLDASRAVSNADAAAGTAELINSVSVDEEI